MIEDKPSTRKVRQVNLFAWGLSTVVMVLAVWIWGSLYDWDLGNLNLYQLFPLFGLLAFSLMWGHYIVAAVRIYLGLDKGSTARYFEVTSFVVLLSILLHPGLLTWQLISNGLGLPPLSYFDYVGSALRVPVLLGELALLIFLAYEFRRWFSRKSWWPYMQYLSDAAMLLIFYHGLRLGSHLRGGWFRGVWLFYGVTLVMSMAYVYSKKLSSKLS